MQIASWHVPSALLRQNFSSFLIVFSSSPSSPLPLFKDEDLVECTFPRTYINPSAATSLAVVAIVVIFSFDSAVVAACCFHIIEKFLETL